MNEKKIIAAIRRRDEQGARDLLTYYGPLMHYVISPILPEEAEREDCLSEAVLRVWEKIDQFDPQRGSWTSWLTAIARNAALNRSRRARPHPSLEELSPQTPSPEPTPEQIVLERERRQAVYQAIRRLTQEEQLLFYRKYYYLQSTAQIAAELSLSPRAVEGRLYRLKQRLRRLLGGEWHD